MSSSTHHAFEGGVHLQNKVVIPRQYQTSDELDRLREQSALLIQRHVRGFLAKLIRAELKEAHDERIRIQFEEEQEYQVQRQLINEYEIQRRLQVGAGGLSQLLFSQPCCGTAFPCGGC